MHGILLDLTAAREKGEVVYVLVVVGHCSHKRLDQEQLVETRPFVELVDEKRLLTVVYEAVASKHVDYEHVLFGVRLDVSADLLNGFHDFGKLWIDKLVSLGFDQCWIRGGHHRIFKPLAVVDYAREVLHGLLYFILALHPNGVESRGGILEENDLRWFELGGGLLCVNCLQSCH